MRRSSSSSSIPHRASRLPVRDSLHPPQNSGKVMNKLQGQEKHSLTNSARTSSYSNLLDIVQVRNQRSGSLVRQTLCTPLSQSRYSRLNHKSPGLSSIKKDSRPITDKHWQYDHLYKVRNFVIKYFDHLKLYDINTIKSGMTMDVFVSLINNYFQILDHQVFIKRDNYVDEVPKLLRIFGYPGNVKPSLMKTVNTPHSWPHILAIFSWLSDLIVEIDIPDDYLPFSGIYNVVYQQTLDLLQQLNDSKEPEEVTRKNCLTKIDNEIVDYLKLDVNLLQGIDNQMHRLEGDLAKSEARNTELKNNIEKLQIESKELTEKCDMYEHQSKTFVKQLEQQKNKHLELINSMGEEMKRLREHEKQLQATINTQPYSLYQKEKLMKELTSSQMSKELQEQRQQQQQKLIHEYDSKLTELLQVIQSNAYKYNNLVNNLELSNPEFKKLHIRESGFLRKDIDEELNYSNKLLQSAIEKIKKGSESCEVDVSKLTRKEKKLLESLDEVDKEIEELKKLNAELVLTIEFEGKQADLKRRKLLVEVNKCQSELTDLKKVRVDLGPLENEVDAAQKQKVELEELYQNHKTESLFFFHQLQKQMDQTAISYMNIMRSISDTLCNTLDNADLKCVEELELSQANIDLPK